MIQKDSNKIAVLKEFESNVQLAIGNLCTKHNVLYIDFIGWVSENPVRLSKYRELKQTQEAIKRGERKPAV